MKHVSLFTGIGGLDYGLEKMGSECVAFSEIKESSARIYSSHYPGRRNLGDITKVKFEDIPDFDILTGGFPCQSFSLAGVRRGFEDRRGKMIFYIYDLLLAKKPQFAVLENVKGILNHDDGKTYRNVFKLLVAAGYFVRCVLLNSIFYGNAQSRERVFFLCSRTDFPLKVPEVRDNTKRFRDFRDVKGPYKFLTPLATKRLEETGKWCVPIGGYDRVNTFTTSESSCGNDRLMVQEEDDRWRYLTCLEAERLQGFPEGWTEGERKVDRWYALGNAVNCMTSNYLFNDYLKGVWW